MDKYEIIRQLRVALPIYQRMDEYAKKMKTVNYTGAGTIILAALIPVLMCAVIPSMLSFRLIMLNNQGVISAPPALIGVIWGLCITIGIVGLVFVLIYSSKSKKNKKNQLIKEKEQFVQNNWCPELVLLPPDYRYFMACSYILSCFENMRADTMKEAINLYVEQLDRWRQEQLLKNIQAQTAQIQREQAASNDFFETAIIIGLMR